jgi:putative ABC transport system permease protein
MSSLRLAWLHLVRTRTSTIVAVIAIALSVALAGMLLRIYLLSASRFSSLASGPDAIVGAKAGGIEILLGSLNLEGPIPGYLPQKLFDSLRAQTDVHFEDGANHKPSEIALIVPFLYFAKSDQYRIIGTDETFFKRPSHPLTFKEGSFTGKDGEAVVGSIVAQERGLKIGDSIPANIWISDGGFGPALPLKVVGILNPTATAWDRGSFVSLLFAQAVLRTVSLSHQSIWGADVLSYFLVDLNPGGLKPLQDLIDKRTVGQIIDVTIQKSRLEELTGTGRNLGLLVTAFIVVLGGLSVATLMATRFESMSVQMAVLRALGYSRGALSSWLLWEGLLIGTGACAIGSLIDLVCFPILRSSLGAAVPPADVVSSTILSSSAVWLATIIGTTLAVCIPLLRVYRQDVHSALKGL